MNYAWRTLIPIIILMNKKVIADNGTKYGNDNAMKVWRKIQRKVIVIVITIIRKSHITHKVQARATKLIPSIQHPPVEERLAKLKLPVTTLEKRRER